MTGFSIYFAPNIRRAIDQDNIKYTTTAVAMRMCIFVDKIISVKDITIEFLEC